ncbi:MAG: hypothetical protein PHN75_17370, partial [Syntrophales bacterium]|nr:hypothetical protein [Syntrophales bacterium]
ALFEYIKANLEEKVKEVKPSTHLKESAAGLSGDEYGMSAYMEKIIKAAGQEAPATKRVLEINMDHPLVARIKKMYDEDKETPMLKDYTQLLFDLAVVSEGGKLENPTRFSKMIGDLAANSL